MSGLATKGNTEAMSDLQKVFTVLALVVKTVYVSAVLTRVLVRLEL